MNRGRATTTKGPVQAVWHDGKSAAGRRVAMFLPAHMNEIRLCEEGGNDFVRPLAAWPLGKVRVVSGKAAAFAAQPVRLALEPDDGARLTVEPGPGLDELSAWLAPFQRSARQRVLRRWAVVCLAAWAVGLALYFSGPAVFSLAAAVVPRSVEESLGRNARDNVVKALSFTPGVSGVNEAAGASPDLAALLKRLEQGAPVGRYSFDVQVLDADFINAFALPGGYMLVSGALIRDCASPDELAGVLAHEMAHVTSRHGTAAVLRQQVWAMAARMAGLTDSIAGNLASALLESSFSREQERQADRLGAARLVGASINPLGMADFFARMEKRDHSGTPFMDYLASHPPSGERRDSIRHALESGELHNDVARQGTGAPIEGCAPAMDAEAWARFRALVPGKETPDEKAAGAEAQEAPSGASSRHETGNE